MDVRTPEEFTGDGHAPGAVNVPLGPTLPQDFKAKFPDNNAKLLVVRARLRGAQACPLTLPEVLAVWSQQRGALGCRAGDAGTSTTTSARRPSCPQACRGGNRSTTALNTLGEAYPNAVNFRGSWMAWVQAGLPLER